MRFSDVVRLLEQKRDLPIKPDDIKRIIVEGGIRDDIIYIGVDINAQVLRGKLVQILDERNPSPIMGPYNLQTTGLISKVYYAVKQDDDIKGIATIKELLHIVDPASVTTSNPQQVTDLFSKLSLPAEVNEMAKRSVQNGDYEHLHLAVDLYAEYRAVVAMVPERHRLLILEKYKERKLSIEEIARLTGLTPYYTRAVLSDVWPAIRASWLQI